MDKGKMTAQEFVKLIRVDGSGNKPMVVVAQPGKGATKFFTDVNSMIGDDSIKLNVVDWQSAPRVAPRPVDNHAYLLHEEKQFDGNHDVFDWYEIGLDRSGDEPVPFIQKHRT